MKRIILVSLLLLTTINTAIAEGLLSPNYIISSKYLGYDLHYRVYLPDGVKDTDKVPAIYLTDGQGYIAYGHIIEVLDSEIAKGNIKPIAAIFIDSRDPHDLSKNRRNDEFQCNKNYAYFYINELIPTINANFPVSEDRKDRVIGGISFGGLNAACFGLMANNMFSGIAMQSPANTEHLKLLKTMYRKVDKQPIKMFFSIGTKRDNTRAARKFYNLLKSKAYDINYIEVPFGHEWANWRPLMDDMLQTFFKNEQGTSNN